MLSVFTFKSLSLCHGHKDYLLHCFLKHYRIAFIFKTNPTENDFIHYSRGLVSTLFPVGTIFFSLHIEHRLISAGRS